MSECSKCGRSTSLAIKGSEVCDFCEGYSRAEKDCSEEIDSLRAENERLKCSFIVSQQQHTALLGLLQAVGHVGVDFGYGDFELSDLEIQLARDLYAELNFLDQGAGNKSAKDNKAEHKGLHKSGFLWTKTNETLPEFASNRKVVIYTDGHDFDGEMFFCIDADALHPTEFPYDQNEVAEYATHWVYMEDLIEQVISGDFDQGAVGE